MMHSKFHFTFKQLEEKERSLVHEWLVKPHIAEWIHGVGLQNTLSGLEKFFLGETQTTYWIAYDKNTPFAFLITSPEGNDATTLDVFICDLNYLGKGIAVPMIQEFLINQFPNQKRVLIDPEATNKKAIHVYQKVGFKVIGEFIASWHPVPHYLMELHMKNLMKNTEIRLATTDDQIRSCYKIMQQLRPYLSSEQKFVEQVQRQIQEGYSLAYIQDDNQVKALAGFRFLEFLAWGKVLYIDDLVSNAATRRIGNGSTLLKWVIDKAKKAKCNQIHLDSGPQRHDAHKFYLNHGFKIMDLHFALDLKENV